MSSMKQDVSAVMDMMHKKMGVTKKKRKYAMKPEKHTSSSFDNEIKETVDLFLKMGEVVANQVAQAVHALVDSDSNLAEKVIKSDEKVNQIECEIDEKVMHLVIMRQPTANDYRLVIALSKGVVDIERIGDEACKIARMAKDLTEHGSSPLGYSEVQHLSNQVRLMIHEALDAFRNFDAEQAFEVMQSDSVINREYQTAIRALMTYIMEDSRHVSKVINVMWVLRALERIGDHAKNIAELVIFMSSGTDVRHTSFDEVQLAVQEANMKAAAYQEQQAKKLNDENQNDDGE